MNFYYNFSICTFETKIDYIRPVWVWNMYLYYLIVNQSVFNEYYSS